MARMHKILGVQCRIKIFFFMIYWVLEANCTIKIIRITSLYTKLTQNKNK